MVALGRSRLFLFYVLISAALIGAISILQCFRYGVFGTDLLLGWDSPKYVWMAREVLSRGPLDSAGIIIHPHLYVLLLAFLGYVIGDVVVVERVLPLVFAALLVFAYARVTYGVTRNVHMAGLAALLTGLSINALRLYADLNRNLMALSLSFASFLPISTFINHEVIDRRSLLSKNYLFIILAFLVIAGTQFETFFILALSTVLAGVLSRSWKKLVALTLAPAIPAAVVLGLFPGLLPRYLGEIGLFAGKLTFDKVFLWSGGSYILFGFLIAGAAYVFYKAIRQRDILASMLFSWVAVIALMVFVITQGVLPLSVDYALRALLILPIPVFFALAAFASANLLKDVFFEIGVSSLTKRHAVTVSLKRVTVFGSALILLAGSLAVSSQHYDDFLTPYIPKSSYDRISTAGWFLRTNGLSKPIVAFYGEESSWFVSLYNNYIGAEVGEHFSYNGDISGLLSSIEDRSGYYRESMETSPILVITPDLYNREVPYSVARFHIGQGIYVVPPNSVSPHEIFYGPTVMVVGEDGAREVRSEYLYADPNDPSLIVLRVAATGCSSYTFENYPSEWEFVGIEQGRALSFPEQDPRRLDGVDAIEGNDPAESTQDWSMLQTGAIIIDNVNRKEGSAGLKVEGSTDSWGNLGARYNVAGTWDLGMQSTLAIWARADQETTFSITLADSAGNRRTYWDIQSYGSSATTRWKRFSVNLDDYTSQTSGFDLTMVDYIDFYVYSNPGESMSLWIDDLVTDVSPSLDGFIYKARILDRETTIVYFSTRIE